MMLWGLPGAQPANAADLAFLEVLVESPGKGPRG